jgi:hypothetical protein
VGAPLGLGGKPSPRGRRPHLGGGARAGAPSSLPLYIVGGGEGSRTLHPGAALPLSYSHLHPVAPGKDLPDHHVHHQHHTIVLPVIPSTSPSPLLDQDGGDVPDPHVC